MKTFKEVLLVVAMAGFWAFTLPAAAIFFSVCLLMQKCAVATAARPVRPRLTVAPI